MPAIDKVIADILEREGYASNEDFIKDMALWLALARKRAIQGRMPALRGAI